MRFLRRFTSFAENDAPLVSGSAPPAESPPPPASGHPANESNLAALRQRILPNLLVGVALVAMPVLLPLALGAFRRGQAWVILLIVVIYIAGWVVALARRVPYPVKVYFTVIAFYLTGLFNLLQSGLSAGTGIYLLTWTSICGLLLGGWGFAGAMALSTLSLGGVGFLVLSGRLVFPNLAANLANGMDWMGATLLYLGVGTLLSLALNAFLRDFAESPAAQGQASHELDAEQQQLRQRTAELERREVQIRTAAEISRALGAMLERATLLQSVVDLLQQRFNLYYAGVFLLDEAGEYAVLQAGSGEAGQAMVAEKHQLQAGGESMVGWATANRQPRIALEAERDAVRFRNPHLPLTRSEMALPLLAGDRVLGALSVQSALENAFDEQDILVMQGIADSLATALENARLFDRLEASLEEIQNLHRQYLAQSWREARRRGELVDYTYQPEAAVPAGQQLEVPLSLRGTDLGQILLELDETTLSPEDRRFIEAVATEAALALENARLLAQTQRNAAHERIVSEISAKVWAAPDIDSILKIALTELAQALEAVQGSIQLRSGAPDNGREGD